MSIEKAPQIKEEDLLAAMLLPRSGRMEELVERINASFDYWDIVKDKQCPDGCTATQLWTAVKATRRMHAIPVWEKYNMTLSLTNLMQRMCHDFDRIGGGKNREADFILDATGKERYLISSLMEEAIYSSQMEGAATTREVAKEMLRKKMTPKDNSQQMIHNNYQALQFIVAHKDEPLSEELLLRVHLLMTENTLLHPEEAGHFRTHNWVEENGITHETVHTPPSYEEIPPFVSDLCHFFNEKHPHLFIHPILRGIIIHFMIAYVHPFADGNGRMARAMCYWYMLRQGYGLMEYLSISRVIAQSKRAYEKAFRYVETDEMDLGYFVVFHLNVLERSFQQLQAYIKRKQAERNEASYFCRLGYINERQALILKILEKEPGKILTIKDLQAKFLISPTTAKTDINGLLHRGILAEIAFNKVKKGYIRGENFEEVVK